MITMTIFKKEKNFRPHAWGMPYPTLFHVPLPSLGRPYLTLFLSVPFSLTDQIQQDPNKKLFNSDPHSPTNLNANATISLQCID